jgi:hypothetical protein
MSKFATFKEISIGGVTKEELLQKLRSSDVQFNKYAEILFNHPSFTPPDKIESVQLVKVKLSDFALDNPCSYQELTIRASHAGLKLCPLYLSAFLRLSFLDQPEGPYLTVASAKPESHEDYPNGFYIRNHDKALWLRGYRADDFCEWPNDNEFIFLT